MEPSSPLASQNGDDSVDEQIDEDVEELIGTLEQGNGEVSLLPGTAWKN